MENDAGASRIGLGGGEERDGRGWCEEGGARGELFIGARGKGGAVELPDSGELPSAAINGAQRCRGDATARWYRRGRWSRGGGRSGAKLPCAAGWQRGGRRRRPEVTSARGRRTDDEAADLWGRLVRGSECARERAADGWGRLVSESEGEERAGARARRQAAVGPKAGSAGAWEKGGLRVLGRDSVQQGKERVFILFFFFTFQPSFPFLPFFF